MKSTEFKIPKFDMNSLQFVPESLIKLREELAHHKDIVFEAAKAVSFEEAIGTIAAKLNIVLDGDYDPDDLFSMLARALRNRNADRALTPNAMPELQAVQLIETEDGIHLLPEKDDDIRKEAMRHNNPRYNKQTEKNDLPPYTVCDKCVNWGECCEHRTCELGSPAMQLGWAISDRKKGVDIDK